MAKRHTMQTLVIRNKSLVIEKRDYPSSTHGVALLRSPLVGICRTDLAAASGAIACPDGIAFGHEFCARVEASEKFASNALVAGTPFLDRKFRGVATDGVCSQMLLAEEDSLYEFPHDFPETVAALLEPICASLAPIKALPRHAKKVAIVGQGRLAQLAWMGLSSRCDAQLLTLAEAKLIAEKGGAFDFVVETCAATPGAFDTLLALCSDGGRLCVKSRNLGSAKFDWDKALTREIEIHPTLYGDWEMARDFTIERVSDLLPLCGSVHSLHDWKSAIDSALGGEDKKVFIRAA